LALEITKEGSRSVGVTSGKEGGRLSYTIHTEVIVIVGPVIRHVNL